MGEHDEDRAKRAMSDPEIQALLMEVQIITIIQEFLF